jgi:hypothetical protein
MHPTRGAVTWRAGPDRGTEAAAHGRSKPGAVACYRGPVANHIREVTLRPVAAGAGDADEPGEPAGHALFIALEIAEPEHLLGFLEAVVTRFKTERMAGPADTRFMLITVTGEITAADFVHAWQAAIADDAPACALLGVMQQADVMQGDPEGRMIGHASLLAG